MHIRQTTLNIPPSPSNRLTSEGFAGRRPRGLQSSSYKSPRRRLNLTLPSCTKYSTGSTQLTRSRSLPLWSPSESLSRNQEKVVRHASQSSWPYNFISAIEFLISIRIRDVKCDETQPPCQRCTSTGRTCDGYAGSPSPVHL